MEGFFFIVSKQFVYITGIVFIYPLWAFSTNERNFKMVGLVLKLQGGYTKYHLFFVSLGQPG